MNNWEKRCGICWAFSDKLPEGQKLQSLMDGWCKYESKQVSKHAVCKAGFDQKGEGHEKTN